MAHTHDSRWGAAWRRYGSLAGQITAILVLGLVFAWVILAATGCAPPLVQHRLPPEPAPTSNVGVDLVVCAAAPVDNYCPGAKGAHVNVYPFTLATPDDNGYVWLPSLPLTATVEIAAQADGFHDFDSGPGVRVADLFAENQAGRHNFLTLTAKTQHVDPSVIPLDVLAQFKGALFTARAPLSQGPRPGQPTNVITFERAPDWFTEADWQLVVDALHARGYRQVPVGPLVGDDCYHGVYRPCNQALTEDARDRFLDVVQRLWDAGFYPVYRHKPDGWERPEYAAQLEALDRLMSTPRAQQLLRIVTYAGWEPNGERYGWTNRTYVEMLARGAQVFPTALRTLHTTCDVEVPIGPSDKRDPRGYVEDPALTSVSPGFANAWRNVEPYIHVWEQQICGYVDGGFEQPQPDFLKELRWVLQNQPQRTRPGGMWFGPTAWGPNRGLTWVLSEWGSYRDFWEDWREDYARQIGDFAMCNGADGVFDGAHVSVPLTPADRAQYCR